MNTQLYASLNLVNNNEFSDCQSPIVLEHKLDTKINGNVVRYKEKKSDSTFVIENKNGEDKEVFIKYITLVDYLKYFIGKYKNEDTSVLPSKEMITNEELQTSKYLKYIHDKNNYSYVDSFFYYLSGKLIDSGFVHSLECYGIFSCLKKNCRINIADDFEYLCDSHYFNENVNNEFHFEDENIGKIFETTRKERVTICDDTNIESQIETLPNIELSYGEEELGNIQNELVEINSILIDDETENLVCVKPRQSSRTTDDSDTDDDSVNDSDDESESEINEEYSNTSESYGSCTESEKSDDSETHGSYDSDSVSDSDDEADELYMKIKSIPTQIVVIEKCENTLDHLLEHDLLTIEELESCIFQIIVTLHTFQSIFDFTHNDLHTNNIMYVTTEVTHLTYIICGKTYFVPTFGKIYKIIDFGRSIYKCNNTLFCSDSFSSNGTAHTQYNFGPYYNEKKPIVEPNKSFDLCRLACSLFDFICDDINNVNDYRKDVKIYDLIFSWIYDDNGRNVLYKSNGEDKYPGFKLYKMISKLVHNHIPIEQLNHSCFDKYLQSDVESINSNKIDIDDLIDSHQKSGSFVNT